MQSSELQQRVQQQLQQEFRKLERHSTFAEGDDSFAEKFLEVVTRIFAKVTAGGVWLNPRDASLPRLVSHQKFDPSWLDTQSEIAKRHQTLISQFFKTGQSGVLVAKHDEASTGEGTNPFPFHLVLAPARVENRVVGIVELFVDPEISPSDLRGNLQVLQQFANLIGRWSAFESVHHAERREAFLSRLVTFSREIHASIDLAETCYAIANETRLLLGCNRVSVLTNDRDHCQLMAVSGQSTIEQRSQMARALTELAQVVAYSEEPLIYEGQPLDLPPQIERPLDDYLDQSFAKSVLVFPLVRSSATVTTPLENPLASNDHVKLPREVFGTLVLEQLDGETVDEEAMRRVQPLLDHIGSALANAIEHSRIPFLPWINRTQQLFERQRFPKLAWTAGLLLATLLFLAFWPTEFSIRTSGVLQPVERRDVFADLDGVVRHVHVKHADRVEPGDLLVSLENTDLEVRLADIVGQLQSAQQQALAAEKKMVGNSNLRLIERHQISQERDLLSKKIEALTRQLHLLQAQRDLLAVRSKMAGSVITWELQKHLAHRPVSRGEVLLTLANLQNQWEADLFVPERRIGHVVRAQNAQQEPLHVEFVSKTNPGEQTPGKARSVRGSAELHETKGLGVHVSVEFEKQGDENFYPGAEITAKIHCGQRSVGYVWFHQMVEWVYENFLF